MTESVEPEHAREIVDRLEDEVLDVAGAARAGEEGGEAEDRNAPDHTGTVDGAPEPPD